MVYLNICARYYEWVDPSLRHDDNSTSLLMIYVLMGFSLTSDFRFFLLVTTPLTVICISVELALRTNMAVQANSCDQTTDISTECIAPGADYNWREELIEIGRCLLPIILGIYFQKKTFVRHFTSRENEQFQQKQIEKMFMQQADGFVILKKLNKTDAVVSDNASTCAQTNLGGTDNTGK